MAVVERLPLEFGYEGVSEQAREPITTTRMIMTAMAFGNEFNDEFDDKSSENNNKNFNGSH